ncbi:MAG: M20/M25/M40 family metallo-hydrolase [Actinomycetota bacterium]
MADYSSIRKVVDAHAARYIDSLKQACSIPSVSTEGKGIAEMTGWLQAKLETLGAEVRRLAVPGSAEALLAEFPAPAPASARTLMIYDHYDVQPVDPIELWDSPPFEPTEKDGKIFARGAADNKGDLVARLCAIEAYKELYGDLPFNLKFFIEGEEESGSYNFDAICKKFAEDLKADDCVWEGAWLDLDGHPTVYYGCKGLLYLELRCKALSGDQHSSIAVYAPSAAWELLRAIGSLKDADGRIRVDGFFNDIVTPSPAEEKMIEEIPFNEQAMLESLGIAEFLDGLTGARLKKQMLYSPTINIAGFHTGYGVPGATKTVLPAEALAKLDLRLVPDQDAEDIAGKVRKHLESEGFGEIEVEVLSGENPSRSPRDSVLGKAAEKAAEGWFTQPRVVYPFMWATGPMHSIAQTLGIPICSPPGVGRPDSHLHAPNENCRVDDFLGVVGYTVAYLAEYGGTP